MLEDISALAQDEEASATMNKSTYVVLFREGETIKNKIGRVCDIFSSERFEIPNNYEGKKAELILQISETASLIKITKEQIQQALADFTNTYLGFDVSAIQFYIWYLEKEKLLYQKMNMLKGENLLLRGICWCPIEDAEKVGELLSGFQKKRGGTIAKFMKVQDHPLNPPTYLKVNDFISPFQEIVSTYGIPSYREVNPAFFTIITFPFLFGVMFGDVCHGLIMLCFSIYLCNSKESLIKSKSSLIPLLKVRYLFLMMSIFSTFCGLIYNDFAGLNFNFFQTCYTPHWLPDVGHYNVTKSPNCVYPLGIDPFWKVLNKAITI